MSRLVYLLTGLLYLGVQGASLLHGDDLLPAGCGGCPNGEERAAWECAPGDCSDPTHHHHRHDRHHQPGSCRICTSCHAAIAEGQALVESTLLVEFTPCTAHRTIATPRPAGPLSRAPPMADPFPA